MALAADEDTTDAMTECFIEEFMRLRYDHEQILALFRNPHYTGMNMVLQNRGSSYVKDLVTEVFARWGRIVEWSHCSSPTNLSCEPGQLSIDSAPSGPFPNLKSKP